MAEKKISISHLPRKVTEELLTDIFRKSGFVVSVSIKKHRKATLEFLYEDAVQRAINDYNKFKLYGKYIKVKKYRRKSSRRHRERKHKDRSHSKSDERNDSRHHDSRRKSSHEHKASPSNYHQRSSEKKLPFKFSDSDRTFPMKNRFKIGKKALRRMPWKAQQMQEEKKWPSSEFIANVVKRFGRDEVPQKGRILGGYYIQPKLENGKRI
uniref:RRM domain-containing protein n=1 Tax=Panagrolaimus sp. ES5 TaxID=591445 RepID=A0AC34GSJ1_9BILA